MSIKVIIIKDGPAIIQADEQIGINSEIPVPGKQDRETVAICRCGRSRDKVWCDGSHKTEAIEDGI